MIINLNEKFIKDSNLNIFFLFFFLTTLKISFAYIFNEILNKWRYYDAFKKESIKNANTGLNLSSFILQFL